MKYNKLVRDRIPEIIANSGQVAVIHTAEAREYEQKLLEKLEEEVKEIIADASKEELADLLEVTYAICALKNYELEEIETIRQKKQQERGGFKDRIILEETKPKKEVA